jgi:uncharacterized protein YjeT (DUF2065 family)
MDDFIAAVGLVFFIEGLLFAAFPAFVRARIADVLESSEGRMRVVGLVAAILGLGIVFYARQF